MKVLNISQPYIKEGNCESDTRNVEVRSFSLSVIFYGYGLLKRNNRKCHTAFILPICKLKEPYRKLIYPPNTLIGRSVHILKDDFLCI